MEPIAVQNESSAHRGEAGGWEQFVTRYDRPLGVAVRRALVRFGLPPRREQIEDTVQEVWCRLLEAGPRPVAFYGRSERESAAYLGRVARSVVVDQLRNRRAAKRGGDWQQVGAADADDDPAERVADPSPTPEQRLLTGERRRLFLDRCRRAAGGGAIGRRNLWILERSLLDAWSSREIAAAAGGTLRASTVDTLIYRMRGRLATAGVHLPRRRQRRRR